MATTKKTAATTDNKSAAWIAGWLDAVQDGSATMSQRTRDSVDAHGGLQATKKAANERGVHLVELTDDKGRQLIAASKHPFRTIC